MHVASRRRARPTSLCPPGPVPGGHSAVSGRHHPPGSQPHTRCTRAVGASPTTASTRPHPSAPYPTTRPARRARALTQALRTPPHAPHGEHAPSPNLSVPHHTPRTASTAPHPPPPHPSTRRDPRARALTLARRTPPLAPHGEHAPSPKRSVPHHTPGRVHGASSAVTVPVPGSPPVPVRRAHRRSAPAPWPRTRRQYRPHRRPGRRWCAHAPPRARSHRVR